MCGLRTVIAPEVASGVVVAEAQVELLVEDSQVEFEPQLPVATERKKVPETT